jgi:group I intron endonuclease
MTTSELPGVYQIRNTINGKVYIGSATRRIAGRWIEHRKHLKKGIHHSRHLQRAWDTHGQDAFVFEVIENCAAEDCICIEQKHIDSKAAAKKGTGYNIAPFAGNCRGVQHTIETRKKLSAARTGAKATPEARRNMAAAAVGKPKSAQAIEKTANAHRGVPKSEAQRQKISLALKGRKLTVEHAKKSAESRRGKPLSLSHKQKLSTSGKARPPRSEEWSKKIAAANTGKKQSPEVIAKRVAAFRLAIERRRCVR